MTKLSTKTVAPLYKISYGEKMMKRWLVVMFSIFVVQLFCSTKSVFALEPTKSELACEKLQYTDSSDDYERCKHEMVGKTLDEYLVSFCWNFTIADKQIDCLKRGANKKFAQVTLEFCDLTRNSDKALDCLDLIANAQFDSDAITVCDHHFRDNQNRFACLKNIKNQEFKPERVKYCFKMSAGDDILNCLALVGSQSMVASRFNSCVQHTRSDDFFTCMKTSPQESRIARIIFLGIVILASIGINVLIVVVILRRRHKNQQLAQFSSEPKP